MSDVADLLRRATELDDVLVPPVDRIRAAARPRKRRRRAARAAALVCAAGAVAATALVTTRQDAPASVAAGNELGTVQVPSNVQRALNGYDRPSGYRIGDPVILLARADLPNGQYLAMVAPADPRLAGRCVVTFIGPAGDGLTSACGDAASTPFYAAGHDVDASAAHVDTITWAQGRAPRGTATVTGTDAEQAVTVPTFDAGPEWDHAEFFLIPLTREQEKLRREYVARADDGTETGRAER